jgi:hypothetical protein
VSRLERIALAVFREEDWPRLREEADDVDRLEASWKEWEKNLIATEDQLDRLGIKYREIEVNLDELAGFCIEKRLPNTAEARSEFATERMRRKKPHAPPEDGA